MDESINGEIVPPNRWRHYHQASKSPRKQNSDCEGHATTERRATQAGKLSFAFRPIFPVDVGLKFLDQKPPVLAGKATTAFLSLRLAIDHSARRRVFVNPFLAHVRDRHDDERIEQLFTNQALGCFINAPFYARERG